MYHRPLRPNPSAGNFQNVTHFAFTISDEKSLRRPYIIIYKSENVQIFIDIHQYGTSIHLPAKSANKGEIQFNGDSTPTKIMRTLTPAQSTTKPRDPGDALPKCYSKSTLPDPIQYHKNNLHIAAKN